MRAFRLKFDRDAASATLINRHFKVTGSEKLAPVAGRANRVKNARMLPVAGLVFDVGHIDRLHFVSPFLSDHLTVSEYYRHRNCVSRRKYDFPTNGRYIAV